MQLSPDQRAAPGATRVTAPLRPFVPHVGLNPTGATGVDPLATAPVAAPVAGYGLDASGDDGDQADTPAVRPYKLSKLKQQYSDYLNSKVEEIEEAREANRYYHMSQHSAQEIETLRKRGQPIVTSPALATKINGVCGLVEKLRQDPKAYPRTPKHDDGAELATAALNFCLDANQWKAISPDAALDGSVQGIAGIAIDLMPGDTGDQDIEVKDVDPRNFFYDPRSSQADFSDARYMGIAKWVDIGEAQEMFPEHAEALKDYMSGGTADDTTSGLDDRDVKWTSSREKRVRLVEHWYKRGGEWLYCYYTGEMKLREGVSPFKDEKGRTFARFVMYSNMVDQDDDRYGFVRILKPWIDEAIHRRSKALHALNTRRVTLEEGAVNSIETLREQVAKSDGVVVVNPGYSDKLAIDGPDKAQDIQGNLALLQQTMGEIDKFGPNPQLMGEAAGAKSGRAIALLQQAGIAELGGFILRYRGWKIRVYRAIWNAIQQFWTAERWIRVTDSDGLAQFIQINGQEQNPMTGQSVMVNAIGSLDVDIILDEGPDQVNSMADAFDTLVALAQSTKVPIPPAVILALSSLPSSVKKEILGKLEQPPDPMQQQAGAMKLQNLQADTLTKVASAKHKEAQANHANALAQLDAEAPILAAREQAREHAFAVVQGDKDATHEAALEAAHAGHSAHLRLLDMAAQPIQSGQ